MRARSKTFLRNLDEAVLEHRKIACPNIDCQDIVVSTETIQSKNHSILEYHCLNEQCCYHAKRKILMTHPEQVSDESYHLSGTTVSKQRNWISSLLGLVTLNIGLIATTLKTLFER